jgi:EAL domain-containing protein (putative c-di-GMP-specific phosphodiesterase class I)
MYRAKAAGRGGHEVFEPGMYTAVRERLALERDLRQALERDELRLLYQPIVELDTGRTIGVEALLRWQHPTRGLVSPATFIALAEETGLIVPIGAWTLREACAQGRRWAHEAAEAGRCAPTVSVKISGRQLLEPSIVADVAGSLAESGLSPALLTLEITESVLMQDADATVATLQALKALGVRLAIDDFGTGYSSLSYLQRFPIDVLKIDKAFVDGVARGGSDAVLARTIVTLAGMLELSTVAEGVERRDQHAQLVALGCARGQGYLYARPLAANDVSAALQGVASDRLAVAP